MQLGHAASINALALSPAGRRLAVASGASFRLWDLDCQQWSTQFPEPSSTIDAIAFSPDGRRLVTGTGGRGACVQIWS